MTIEELIERLEKSEKRDRSLDHVIAEMFGTKSRNGTPICAGYFGVGSFTSSIDVAVALCESVLPGMYWSITQGALGNDPQEFDASVWKEDAPWDALQHRGVHKSAPIALLLAILRAKARLND